MQDSETYADMQETETYMNNCYGVEYVRKSLSTLNTIFDFENKLNNNAINTSCSFRKTIYDSTSGEIESNGFEKSSNEILTILVASVLIKEQMQSFADMSLENKLIRLEKGMLTKIESIEILQNPKLKRMHIDYADLKDVFGTEHVAMHATSSENADKIAVKGFDTLMCKRSHRGAGVYLSADNRTCSSFGDQCEANNYTTTFVFARIYVGRNVREGKTNMRDYGEGCITLIEKNSHTFVMSNNFQAYPFAIVKTSFNQKGFRAIDATNQYNWIVSYANRLNDEMGKIVYLNTHRDTLNCLHENGKDFFQYYSNKSNNPQMTMFQNKLTKASKRINDEVIDVILLRHVHLDMILIVKNVYEDSFVYMTAMKEIINRDMAEIFDIFTSVCGSDKMCLAGSRHIDAFDTSKVTWKKGSRKTGKVVYSWDIPVLLALESRKRQNVILFIQKQVKSDKIQITDQIIAKKPTFRRFWVSIDVRVPGEMPANSQKRKYTDMDCEMLNNENGKLHQTESDSKHRK